MRVRLIKRGVSRTGSVEARRQKDSFAETLAHGKFQCDSTGKDGIDIGSMYVTQEYSAQVKEYRRKVTRGTITCAGDTVGRAIKSQKATSSGLMNVDGRMLQVEDVAENRASGCGSGRREEKVRNQRGKRRSEGRLR